MRSKVVSWDNGTFSFWDDVCAYTMEYYSAIKKNTFAQESSPAPQFKSINSSELSLLYGPAFTTVHDYWKTNILLPLKMNVKIFYL